MKITGKVKLEVIKKEDLETLKPKDKERKDNDNAKRESK